MSLVEDIVKECLKNRHKLDTIANALSISGFGRKRAMFSDKLLGLIRIISYYSAPEISRK